MQDELCPKDFLLIPSQCARVTEMLKSRRAQAVAVRNLIIYALWLTLIAHPDLLQLVWISLGPAIPLLMTIPLMSLPIAVVMAARMAPDELSNAQRPYALLTLLCHHFGDYYVVMVKWAELAEAVAMPAPARFVRWLLPVGMACGSGFVVCATYFGPPSAFWVAVRQCVAFNGIFRGSCTLLLRWVEAPAFYPPCRLSFAGAMCLSLSFVLIAAITTPDRRRAFAKRFPLSVSIQLSELQGASLASHVSLDSQTSDSLRSLDDFPVTHRWFRRIASSASSTTANSERSGMLPDHPSNGRSCIPWYARRPWWWERQRERERQQAREACEVGGHTDGRKCVPRKLKWKSS